MKTSDFHGLVDPDPNKFAAMPLECFLEPRLAFKSDSIRVVGPGFSENAAMEHAIELLSERFSERILTPIR